MYPTPSSNLFLAEAESRYKQENALAGNIEPAATNLVGWNGLIISVLLTGGGILLSREASIHFSLVEAILLAVTMVSFFVSLTLAIFAFRKGRYSIIPNPVFLLEHFQRMAAPRLTEELTLEMIFASIKNRVISERRQDYISASQITFIISMFLAIVFLILEVLILV